MQAIIVVSIGKVAKLRLAVSCQASQFPKGVLVASLDGFLKGFKIGIVAYQTDVFCTARTA